MTSARDLIVTSVVPSMLSLLSAANDPEEIILTDEESGEESFEDCLMMYQAEMDVPAHPCVSLVADIPQVQIVEEDKHVDFVSDIKDSEESKSIDDDCPLVELSPSQKINVDFNLKHHLDDHGDDNQERSDHDLYHIEISRQANITIVQEPNRHMQLPQQVTNPPEEFDYSLKQIDHHDNMLNTKPSPEIVKSAERSSLSLAIEDHFTNHELNRLDSNMLGDALPEQSVHTTQSMLSKEANAPLNQKLLDYDKVQLQSFVDNDRHLHVQEQELLFAEEDVHQVIEHSKVSSTPISKNSEFNNHESDLMPLNDEKADPHYHNTKNNALVPRSLSQPEPKEQKTNQIGLHHQIPSAKNNPLPTLPVQSTPENLPASSEIEFVESEVFLSTYNPQSFTLHPQTIKSAEVTYPKDLKLENFAKEFVESYQWAVQHNLESVTIKLSPKELGNLFVALSQDLSSNIQVELTTQDEQTKVLLQQEIVQLSQSFKEVGLVLEKCTVHVAAQSQNQSQQFSDQKNRQQNQMSETVYHHQEEPQAANDHIFYAKI